MDPHHFDADADPTVSGSTTLNFFFIYIRVRVSVTHRDRADGERPREEVAGRPADPGDQADE